MRQFLCFICALVFLAFIAGPGVAQEKAEAASIPASTDYIGAWIGVTDWRAVEGYDNATARWEFRSDGTFVDDGGTVGPWSVGADGYIHFNYPDGGQARYTGTIVGDMLVGTMTAGEYNGVFAARR
jgi:hypothetical protein